MLLLLLVIISFEMKQTVIKLPSTALLAHSVKRHKFFFDGGRAKFTTKKQFKWYHQSIRCVRKMNLRWCVCYRILSKQQQQQQ